MNDPTRRYRARNVSLAAIALVVVAAAIIRLVYAPRSGAEGAEAAATTTRSPGQAAVDARPVDMASTATGIAADVAYDGKTEQLPDGAKVYIFLRPVGQRMPLAVQVYGARDLPVRVEFSGPSSDAAAQPVEVVARLSLSGAVSAQPGDPETVSPPLRFGQLSPGVSLVLAAVAPEVLASAAPAAVAVQSGAGSPGASPAAETGAPPMRIVVRVELGAAVRLPPATTVFLIARAPDAGPMPLAVKRLKVADLPADVVLSDADAMVPERALRDSPRLQVVARASASGDVMPQPGDYEGRSPVFDIEDVPPTVLVSIDQAL